MHYRSLPLLVILGVSTLLNAESPLVPPVIVTGSRSGISWEEFDRQVFIINRNDITAVPFPSFPAAISMSGADVQSRGPLGIQSDLGLRGGTFQQTLVLIDGFRCNDPQTGHHNMDIPLPLEAVDRIEILPGSGSSAHGADAFGGTVNIVSRKPKETFISGRVGGGSFGTASGALATGGSINNMGQIFAIEGGKSDGFMPDRDSKSYAISSRSYLDSIIGSTGLILGLTKKDFGAFDFYTPGLGYASREWTRAYFSGLTHVINADRTVITISGSFHRHDDRFQLDQDNPLIPISQHQTRIWSGSAQASVRPEDWLDITIGAESAQDSIESTSLGNHLRHRFGIFGESSIEIYKGLNILSGLRHDTTGDNRSWSPSGGASWWFTGSSRLRIHAAKSFRIPSFTELYYLDKKKTNTGNSGLKPEEALSYEAGIDWIPSADSSFSFTAFDREQEGTIDWVGPTRKGPWRAVNSDSMRFYGTEALAKARLASIDTFLGLNQTWSRYSSDDYSKYALIYPDRTWKAGLNTILLLETSLSLVFQHRKQHGGGETVLLDCRISRQFHGITAYIEGSNILDRRYEEPVGISQPGIWLGGGISYSWSAHNSTPANP